MEFNVCIDESFYTEQITTLKKVVAEKCSFDEAKLLRVRFEEKVKNLELLLEQAKGKTAQLEVENQNLKTANDQQNEFSTTPIPEKENEIEKSLANEQALKECKSDKEYFKNENVQLKAAETAKVADIKLYCGEQLSLFQQRSQLLERAWEASLNKVQSCLLISTNQKNEKYKN